MNKKGQISIEFILIVTIAFVYIGATVLPIATDSTQAAFDVKAIADTKLSATKMANAFNEASSSSGDMKKTVSIVLPENSEISCDGAIDEVRYKARVTSSGGNPDEVNCVGYVDGEIAGVGETPEYYECSSFVPLVTGASTEFSITGPIFKEAVVEKDDVGISVS